ncbi:hypothetical protein DBIPINDM_001576 [Mesorhizobium sp. AR02]|uniref:hypothetical protein n=1 Tax=Mesorhizobium sp. AR02 TaxID=2865837 RepID=UPI00215DD7C0|nr:hypothetical protein [Mesorhizobium sp. AR02]UVK55086.1 hypothetical protein DBIPINDM_001576 [Mesorhizobium sp. AR02]
MKEVTVPMVISISTLAAGLAVAGMYFGIAVPEARKRSAIEHALLDAARSENEGRCRAAMTEEGIDETSYRNAGGYVSYRELPTGTALILNALFSSDRAHIVCEISLGSSGRVDVINPDDGNGAIE